MKEKFFFITFEGIDGSGKEIQMQNLLNYIRNDDNYPFGNKYSSVWISREPSKITKSGTTIADLIRERDVSNEEATKYFIEDRKEHSKLIKKILRFSHVLLNRFDMSTFTYQHVQGVSFEDIYKMHGFDQGETLIPDLTLIFDLPFEVGYARSVKRSEKKESFEKADFLKAAELAQREAVEWWKVKNSSRKFIIINADQPIEKVKNEMIEKIAMDFMHLENFKLF